jgi:hypothetical protein
MRRGGPQSPFRVSVVGIDGAGKSSTTLRAIDLLSGETVIGKPGRDAFVQTGSQREYCAKKVSDAFERTFRRADATGRRGIIGASRLAFIVYQGWLEPHLVHKFRPTLLLSTRCMILDPAIYGALYWPPLGRLSLWTDRPHAWVRESASGVLAPSAREGIHSSGDRQYI